MSSFLYSSQDLTGVVVKNIFTVFSDGFMFNERCVLGWHEQKEVMRLIQEREENGFVLYALVKFVETWPSVLSSLVEQKHYGGILEVQFRCWSKIRSNKNCIRICRLLLMFQQRWLFFGYLERSAIHQQIV